MLKSSSNKRDFKRLRAKVGRRISKNAATNKSIKVSTKKIQLAQQLQETEVTIPLLVTRLAHYSGVARLTALQELKNVMAKLDNPNEHVSLVLPPCLRNISDEDSEIRQNSMDFFGMIFKLCSSDSFIAMMPMVVTYISSGLTHLSRGVRAAAVHLLHIITNSYPDLLVPFQIKVVNALLMLLKDEAQLASLVNNYKRDSTVKKSSADSKKSSSESSSSSPKLTFLYCILNTLKTFFRRASADRPTSDHSCTWGTLPPQNSAILLRGYGSGGLQLLNSHTSGSMTGSLVLQDNKVFEVEPASHVSSGETVNMCTLIQFLARHWKDLTLQESVVSNENISVLLDICSLVAEMKCVVSAQHMQEYQRLVASTLAQFPYTSKEYTVAVTNSKAAISSMLLSQTLNISLCELALESATAVNNELSLGYLASALESRTQTAGTAHNDATIATTERSVKALGMILLRLDSSAPGVSHVLTLFERLLSAVDKAKDECRLMIVVSEATCGFVLHITGSLSAESAPAAPLLVFVLRLVNSLTEQIFSKHQSTNDTTHYVQKLLQCQLSLLQRFECDDEAFIKHCSGFMSHAFGPKSLYSQTTPQSRLLLLQMIAYIPSLSYTEVLPVVSNALASSPVTTGDEIRHLLQILYLRRQEVDIAAFMDLCISFAETHSKALSSLETEGLITRITTPSSWYALDIARVLIRCSNPAQPQKILAVMLPLLEAAGCDLRCPASLKAAKAQYLRILSTQTVAFELLLASPPTVESGTSTSTPHELETIGKYSVLIVSGSLAMTVSVASDGGRRPSLEACFGPEVCRGILKMQEMFLQHQHPTGGHLLEQYVNGLSSVLRSGTCPDCVVEVCNRLVHLLESELSFSVVNSCVASVLSLTSEIASQSEDCSAAVAKIRSHFSGYL